MAGLTHVKVEDENKIFQLLREGNARRKTEETGANAVSSRSHAVLEIWVTRSDRNHYNKAFSTGGVLTRSRCYRYSPDCSHNVPISILFLNTGSAFL